MQIIAGKLRIKPGQQAVTVNAPPDCTWNLPAANDTDLAHADVIVGFASRRGDLELLRSVFIAVNNGGTAWVAYPQAGRSDADIDRVWLFRALYRYDVGPVTSISIDGTRAAVLLRPGLYTQADITELLAWPDDSVNT